MAGDPVPYLALLGLVALWAILFSIVFAPVVYLGYRYGLWRNRDIAKRSKHRVGF